MYFTDNTTTTIADLPHTCLWFPLAVSYSAVSTRSPILSQTLLQRAWYFRRSENSGMHYDLLTASCLGDLTKK